MGHMQNNVIPIFDESVRFNVKSVFVELDRLLNGEPIIKQHVVIILTNELSQKFVVHPFTSFIYTKWKNKAYNTQKIHAFNLVPFLNFLLNTNRKKYKLNSFSELRFEYATDYLNHLTRKGKSRVTVKSVSRTLTLFYEYLAIKELLIHIDKSSFTKTPLPHNQKKTYTPMPFKGVILPEPDLPNQAHMLPEEYIAPFIETAVRVSHPIALGIYMQCFGGIRIGGLVNIRRGDITSVGAYGEHGIIVKLRKQIMRTDVVDIEGSNYVKKPRRQIVYPIRDWLKSLYKDHIENYQPSDGSDALFVNRDGKAMTGSSYRYHFSKVKKQFLLQLRQSDNPIDRANASKLEEFNWSTHIGRGIFTNLLAEEAANVFDIALPRGDSNISSSLVYQGNTLRMKKKLEARMDDLYKIYIPKLSKNFT